MTAEELQTQIDVLREQLDSLSKQLVDQEMKEKTTKNSFLFYWDYFLSLEKDLLNILEYIQISKENYKTFSIKNTRLILSAGSEIDSVLKNLCNQIDKSKVYKNIGDYRKTIKKFYRKSFAEKQTYIPKYNLSFQPWKNWNKTNSKSNPNPDWWQDYNDIKHNRELNFEKANLKNLLNCMAGLHVALFFYNEELNKKSAFGGIYYIQKWGEKEKEKIFAKDINSDTVLFKLTY